MSITWEDSHLDFHTLGWDSIKEYMDPDGSLRDIIIPDTDDDDRLTLYHHLQSHYLVSFTMDGESSPLPITVSEVKKVRASAAPGLSAMIGDVEVWCVFFGDDEEEIEFSFDPVEVKSMEDMTPILSFMVDVGKLLHRTYANQA